MTKIWKHAKDFLALDKATIEAVPNIKDDVELVTIDEQIRGFESQKKAISKLISLTQNYPREGPMAKLPGVEKDAQALIDGAEPEGLCGPDDIDRRRNLQRQLKAVEQAIVILRDQYLTMTASLVAQACIELEPLAKSFAEDTLAAFEQLAAQLQKQEQFFKLLTRRGIPTGRRPAHWNQTDIENRIIYGGAGLPTLSWYLKSRREYWGLPEKKVT